MQILPATLKAKMDKKPVPGHSHAGKEETHKKNDLLMEKARSVIDAVLALNQLGSDDECSRPSSPFGNDLGETRKSDAQHASAEVKKESSSVQVSSKELQADADSTKKLYWLTEDSSAEDFNGMTFPQKMHHVLRNDQHAEIIAWLPSGRSFVVRDQKKFSADIIPKYFGKHIAYTSFTRRLARWGWQNIAKGTYFNKDFNREHPEQCLLMNYNSAVSNKPADAIPITSGKTKGRTVNDMLGFAGFGGADMAMGMNPMMNTSKKQCSAGSQTMSNPMLNLCHETQLPLHASISMQSQVPAMFHPNMGSNDALSGFANIGGAGNASSLPMVSQVTMQNNAMTQCNTMMLGNPNFQHMAGHQGNQLNMNVIQNTQSNNNATVGNMGNQPLHMMDMSKFSDARTHFAQKCLEMEQLQQRMILEQQMQMQQTFFNQQTQSQSNNMLQQSHMQQQGSHYMPSTGPANGNPPPGTPGRGTDSVFFRNAAA